MKIKGNLDTEFISEEESRRQEFEGKSCITFSLYNEIKKILPEGKTILELGSGWGTSQLAKHYKMISIEDNVEWVNKYDSEYIYAPIKYYDNKWTAPNIPHNIGWYDPYILQSHLKDKEYDMILLDGPAGWKGAPGRAGFLKHLDLFNTNVPIIVDDVQREQEMILLEQISKTLNRPYTLQEPKEGINASDYCAAGIIL
jgi:hypothetical protein|tara:strand:- start:4512 stop:5108 length:597 start_codon:yes stop_codon:yes gene_type:complete